MTDTGSLGPESSPWRARGASRWNRLRRRYWDDHCWPLVRPHHYQFVEASPDHNFTYVVCKCVRCAKTIYIGDTTDLDRDIRGRSAEEGDVG